jgi:PPM family protein phosphatase
VIDPQRVVIAHVGDSRAYLLRDGRLQVLTRDHTIVSELVDRGLLTAEEGERHPYKNVLSRNLGAKPETRIDCLEVALRPGDRLLLCSDGLSDVVDDDAIATTLRGASREECAAHLIELALAAGGRDNISAVVADVAPREDPTTAW